MKNLYPAFVLASFVLLGILCSGCNRDDNNPSGNLGLRDEIIFTATVGNSSVATKSSSEASDASASLSADGKNMEAAHTQQIYYDFARGENISARTSANDNLIPVDTRFSGEVFNVSVDNKAERLDWMPGDKITIFECVSGEFAHYKIDGINPEDGISKAALVPANTDGLRWNKNSDHKFLAIYPHLDSIMIAPEVYEYNKGTSPYPYSVKVRETGANTGSIIPSTQYCTKVEGVRTSENWYEPKMKYAYMLSSALVPSSAVPTSDISLSFSPCFSSVEVKLFKPSGLSSAEVKLKSAVLKGGSGSGADLSGTPALVHSGSDFGFTLSATENNGNALSGFGTAGNADQPNVVNLFFKNTDGSTATPLLEEYSATSKPVCFTFLTLPSTDITQLELTLTLDIGGITETMTMKLKDAQGNWIELPAGKKLTISNAQTWEDEEVTTSTPLTILTTEDNTTITINNAPKGTFEYTVGGYSFSSNEPTFDITVPKAGQAVRLYYSGDNFSPGYAQGIINFTEPCYVYGNIMSLCAPKNSFATATEIPENTYFERLFLDAHNLRFHPTRKLLLPATTLNHYCYISMFEGCTGITEIPEGLLPATTLTTQCYYRMFRGCTGITEIPEGLLPATTLADNCYWEMFLDCTGITEIPAGLLPATTLERACYTGMFSGCTSITEIPEGLLPATTLAPHCYANMFLSNGLIRIPSGFTLPATTLAPSCYASMFKGCTELTDVPYYLLPATILERFCYEDMFMNTKITKAPHLPATEAKLACYRRMFQGCNNLNEVSCNLATNMDYTAGGITDYSSTYYSTKDWLLNVAATGTFYANPSALAGATTYCPTNTTWHIDSPSGIPVNWTQKDLNLKTPLTIEPKYDGTTITIYNPRPQFFTVKYKYSRDGGITKYPLSGTEINITANAGEQISLYQEEEEGYIPVLNLGYASLTPSRAVIDFDQDCFVYGNIMSLVRGNSYSDETTKLLSPDFAGLFYNNTHLLFHQDKKLLLPATSVQSWGYAWMFAGCTGIEEIPEDFLPAETLAYSCYYCMFYGCTGLKSLPEGLLPATELANYCYSNMFARSGLQSLPSGLLSAATTLVPSCYAAMFARCTDLKSLPSGLLPAMVAKDHCYSGMFYGCTGIEEIPEGFLPATDLEERCYYMMFEDCTNLRTVPPGLLPATSLADGCYMMMFQNCSSLTQAPHLPATTPKTECYKWLFYGCTSLTEVSCNLSSFAATDCVKYMLNLKTSTGVFKKNPTVSAATWQSYGVPAGWTFGTYGQ